MTDRRAARGGLYPLWLGLLAGIGLTVAWWLDQPGDEGSEAGAVEDVSADAPTTEPDTDAKPDAPTAPDPIVWQVVGRGPITSEVLDACLTRAGHSRAMVVGSDRLVITHPARVLPVVVASEADRLNVRTPAGRDARLTATLHVAVTECLYAPEAAVLDPLLGRRFTGADWPQASEGGGLPVETLVELSALDAGWVTRGLARLGRPELGLADPDALAASERARGDAATPIAGRVALARAAAAAIVAAADTETLTIGEHDARLLPAAEAARLGWWSGPTDSLALLATDEQPPRALPIPELPAAEVVSAVAPPAALPAKRPRTKRASPARRAPAGATRRPPRRTRRPAAEVPPPATPRGPPIKATPRPRKGEFMPDYR